MTTPEQLDRLISEKQKGNDVMSRTIEEKLAVGLIGFAESFSLDPEFDATLTHKFERSPVGTQPSPHPIQTITIMRVLAASAAALILLTVTVLTVPSLRVLAQDIFSALFPRDGSSHRTFENAGMTFGSEDFVSFATAEELTAGVDFKVYLPDLANTDYVFDHATFLIPRNVVFIAYRQGASPALLPLWISQQPLTDAEEGVFWYTAEQNTISLDAAIIPVQIGEYSGEIVQGDWFTTQTNLRESAEFTWLDDVPVYRLRWQDGMFLHEIRFLSQSDSAVEELIAIAETMTN